MTDTIASLRDSRPPAILMLRRLARRRGAIIGFTILMLLTGLVLSAPLLTDIAPDKIDPLNTFHPPSGAHLMGTDNLGRDIFTRFLFGGRVSLRVGLVATVFGFVIGTTLGMVAGYYGGLLDSFISWGIEVLLAFPGILLALVVTAILGPGIDNVVIAVGISFIPSFTRVSRASVLKAREEGYVDAAVALGSTNSAILTRHLLPNIVRPLIVLATLGIGGAILEGSALSFLGLGVQPPNPEWGAMLSSGRGFMGQAAWVTVFPGLGIFLTILAVNLLGDALGDAADPAYQTH